MKRPLVIIRNDTIIDVFGIENCRVINYDFVDLGRCPACQGSIGFDWKNHNGDLACPVCKVNWEKYDPEILVEKFGG